MTTSPLQSSTSPSTSSSSVPAVSTAPTAPSSLFSMLQKWVISFVKPTEKPDETSKDKDLKEKFTESMAKAESVFTKFAFLDQLAKDKLKTDLDKACQVLGQISKYGDIPQDLLFLSARMFYIYSRCLYYTNDDNHKLGHKVCQMALALHFKAIKILDNVPKIKHFNSVEDAVLSISDFNVDDNRSFQNLNATLIRLNIEGMVKEIASEKEGIAMSIGTNLEWLGFYRQNLDEFSKSPDTTEMFETVYGTAERVFKVIDTKDSRWEFVGTFYNSSRFLYLRKHPEDTEGALKEMEGVLTPYLEAEDGSERAMRTLAQMHNIKAREREAYEKTHPDISVKDKIKNVKANLQDTLKAYEILSKSKQPEPFFLGMFSNNCVGAAVACRKAKEAYGSEWSDVGMPEITDDQIHAWCVAAISQARSAKYQHKYAPGYLLKATEFEIGRKNPRQATLYLLEYQRVAGVNFDQSELSNLYKQIGKLWQGKREVADLVELNQEVDKLTKPKQESSK